MDQDTLRELQLFTENDADIYRQTTTPIVRNLRTKQAQGKYDHDRAADAFMCLAEAGARKYAREHGGGEHEWHKIFPADVRRAAAAAWRDEFEQESASGNYDNATYLPKKYLEQVRADKKPLKSSKSEAWKSGYRDGTKYVHETGVTRQEFERRLTTPRQVLIRRVGGAYKAIEPLGLGGKKKLTDADYDRAFEDYDRGFVSAASAIFNTMEGN